MVIIVRIRKNRTEVFRLEHLRGFLFVFFIGFLGFLLFRRLKVPIPSFLGSFVATGALNLAGYFPEFDIRVFSFLARASTGAFLGKQINRGFLVHVKGIAVYVLVSTVGALAISLITGFTIYSLSDVSLSTALIGGANGGIAEMTAFGMSLQEDVVTILFMLIFRLIFAVMSSYWVVLFISKMIPGRTATARLKPAEESFFRKREYVLLAGVALLGAWLLEALKVPNGVMLGAMLACGLLAVCIRKTYRFELKARHATLITLGVIMGRNITPDVVGELHRLILPGLVSAIVSLVCCTILALILYKISPMDIVTCVLCTSPAGLSQIVFLSEEMGADSLTTSIFQACRLFSIVAFYPWIIIALR